MTPEREPVTIDLSTASILKFFGLIIALFLLWSIRNVVAIVLFSVVIAASISPLVDALHRRRVPRGLAIAFVFIVLIGAIVLIGYLFGQLVSDQVRELAANFPAFYNKAVKLFVGSEQANPTVAETVQRWLQSLNTSLGGLTRQIAVGTFSMFGGLFTFIGVLVLSFYMVVQKDSVKRLIDAIAPVNFIPYLYQLSDRMVLRIGGWARGQLLLSAIIASVTYLGLLAVGIEYTMALALIAGICELVPYIGPFIGAIPAILVAFGHSWVLAIIVAGMYIVIQQLENNFIVPKVMQRTTGLNPLVIIIVMLVGGKLAGVAGVILAIPVTLIINAFFEDFFKESDAEESAGQPEGDV
ncbi:MAG: AI-2E family transporter [Candidatus Kerfeldbacteria bacterium]